MASARSFFRDPVAFVRENAGDRAVVRVGAGPGRFVLLRAPEAGEALPVQVVHGDLGASNALVDERTGEVTGVLDFELAGPEARVQDLLIGLLLSGALAGPGWARRAAALVRGHAAVLHRDAERTVAELEDHLGVSLR